MPSVPQTRHRDRVHLIWVKLRCRGRTASEIAQRFGTTPDDVRTATNRIRNDDIKLSNEPMKKVEKAYQFVGTGKRRTQ